MKEIILIALVLISYNGNTQTFDFGVELRTNSNLLSNRIIQQETTTAIPSHQNSDLSSFALPSYNFAFVDDNNQNVYVRFNQVEMNNNVEVPLFARYVTKNDLYFDFKISTGKYQINYQGGIYRDEQFYKNQYGTFDDFKSNYGDSSSTSEYISWFDSQVKSDFSSQAIARFVEEIKFRSIHLWIGKQFLEHKRVQPFVTGGLHFRTAVSSFKRKHFELDDNFLGQSFTKRDLSDITNEIPNFSNTMLGVGLRAGFHIYRYHFALTSEYSFNLGSGTENGTVIYGYLPVGGGFRTLSMDIGIDLFSHNMRTKNMRDIVYNEEFSSLSSTLDKNRAWTLNVNVKAPVHSRMTSYSEFSLITINEEFNPSNGYTNLDWQSLSFKAIDRVNWIPKIEVGFRYNIVERIDLEFAAGFSKVDIDTKVQEVNAQLIFDGATGEYSYDASVSTANYAVYRSSFAPLFAGANLYLKLLSKDAYDIRVFGGASINAFAMLTSPNVSTELGINGSGKDIYQTAEDAIFQRGVELDLIENIDNSYYSNYAKDVNFSNSAQTLLNNHQNKEDLRSASLDRSIIYPSINLGAEVEFNRFLCGLAGEFTIGKVDDFVVGSYSNISLNFGYILMSKNRLNKKLRD